MTRRDALRVGLSIPAGIIAIPAFSFGPKDFWETKPSTDWSSDEVERMITKSPWAKDAVLSENGQRGGLGSPGRSRVGMGLPGGIGFPGGGYPGGGYPGGMGRPGGYPPNSGAGSPQDNKGGFEATVRWDSALPVQEAMLAGTKDKPDPDFDKFYVVHLLGDLPMLGGPRRSGSQNDDDIDPAQDERREEMFKQYTRLERKNGDLQLEKVVQGSRIGSVGPGVLFYFSRQDEISLDDKQINFVTKLSEIDVRARFTLKDMLYHGKLAL